MEPFLQQKNEESGYYLVKQTSGSFKIQSYHSTGKYVIEAGKLVCDAVYLNALAYFKQWYTTHKK